jgi:hypothetical protein
LTTHRSRASAAWSEWISTNGSAVWSYATEVLVTGGIVRPGRCTLDIALVGMDGEVSAGRLRRGANPVCVTFELLIVASDEEAE